MLLKYENIEEFLIKKKIKGVIHIGAHECQEMVFYKNHFGLENNQVIWIEANPKIYERMKNNYNVFNETIYEEDGKKMSFNITNNEESSSLLNFGSHASNHPHVKFINQIKVITKRMDTFIKDNNVDMENFNFLNLDIQGVELSALKSFGDQLKHIDFIYTEVNTEHVYQNCCLISEIDDYLKTFGFERKIEFIYPQYKWGDALYSKIK